jgi:hypothetical protein
MSTSQSAATLCVAALVFLLIAGSFAARDVPGQQKPRVNPLIARLEQGQAALSGTVSRPRTGVSHDVDA